MSAISYPHGLVDDIKGMNDYLVKNKKNIWIGTDCCLGGYFTSISSKLKDNRFSPVDFSLERVGTITVDPHKYGQSPKGVSIVLFRNMELKCCSLSLHRYWTAGFYGTTSVSGSRPAGPVVGAWISMKLFGLKGIIENYRQITSTTDYLVKELSLMPEIKLVGDPKGCVLAFTTKNKKLLYHIDTVFKEREWMIPMMSKPVGFRFTLTLANIPEFRKNFIKDLKVAIEYALKN